MSANGFYVSKEKKMTMNGSLSQTSVRRTLARRLARASRTAQRGLTLVELVIVITIIGVVTAAIAVGVIQQQKRANIKAAGLACSTIREQTALFFNQNGAGADCPTVDQLKKEKFLDTTFSTKDPWGSPFKVVCDSDEVTVTSPGPDKAPGTEDDIIFPDPKSKSQ